MGTFSFFDFHYTCHTENNIALSDSNLYGLYLSLLRFHFFFLLWYEPTDSTYTRDGYIITFQFIEYCVWLAESVLSIPFSNQCCTCQTKQIDKHENGNFFRFMHSFRENGNRDHNIHTHNTSHSLHENDCNFIFI